MLLLAKKIPKRVSNRHALTGVFTWNARHLLAMLYLKYLPAVPLGLIDTKCRLLSGHFDKFDIARKRTWSLVMGRDLIITKKKCFLWQMCERIVEITISLKKERLTISVDE